jgi:hypothetical protein
MLLCVSIVSRLLRMSSQPSNPSQVCTIARGSGTIAGNVTNVSVTCAGSAFSVGGTVNGLLGSGLVLQNNGADDMSVASNGAFAFRMTRLARYPHIDALAQFTEEGACHGLIERNRGGSCTSITPSWWPSPRTSSMNWSSTSGCGVSSPSWVSVRGTFTENRKCVGTLEAQRAYVCTRWWRRNELLISAAVSRCAYLSNWEPLPASVAW